MAAEYEVNIKINSQQITRQLEDIDKAISKIGKSRGGGSSGKSGISSLSPTRQDLKASADYQKALQGVLKAGRDAEKVFGNLRKTAQSAMVAGANEARQLAAAAAGAPLRSQIGIRPTNVTRASADAAARQLEAQVRASAALEKQLAQEVSAFEMRADKRVLQAGLANDKIEFKQKIDDIIKATDFAIRESKREGKAFDEELRRRGKVQQETQRNTRKRLEGVALGAGFPLLFGGGAGSVLGGGLGGLTGSFGAQIALSAIGQQIDQFVTGITEAAGAFSSLEGVLTLMSERSLFTSKSSEDLAQQLENLGDVEALAELATVELASKIGSDGIKAFQDLETELDEFDRLVGHLMISLQAFLAGPLGNFLEIVNATLGKKVTQGTIDRLAGSLQDPADQARFRAAAKERIGTELEIQGFGPFGLPRSAEVLRSAPLDLLSELSRDVAGGKFGESNLLSRPLKITQEDRESIKPKIDTQLKTAQRLLEASQRRIKILQLETKEIKQITKFKDEIAAAELVGDKRGVARLRRDQALARLKSDEEQAIARINPKLSEQQQSLERINIEAKGVAQAAEIHAEFQRDIAEIIADTNEKFEDQMAFQDELRQKINEQESAYAALNDTFRTGIVDAILDAVEGSESLRDSLLGVIQSMARLILQQQLLKSLEGFNLFPGSGGGGTTFTSPDVLTSGINFFANGGSPPVGRPSIVGERGPELFVPKSAGTIVPNHALGGANVVVNVDASGSQAQGNQPNAKALGTAIGAAVQAELVKQKRPGGLLS